VATSDDSKDMTALLNSIQLKLVEVHHEISGLKKDVGRVEENLVYRVEFDTLKAEVGDLKEDRKKLWWTVITGAIGALGTIIMSNADKLK